MRYIAMILALALAVLLCAAFGGFAGYGWLWLLPVCFVGAVVAILLVYFIFLCILGAAVDTEKPQEKDSKFYRFVVTRTAELGAWLLRIRVHTICLWCRLQRRVEHIRGLLVYRFRADVGSSRREHMWCPLPLSSARCRMPQPCRYRW